MNVYRIDIEGTGATEAETLIDAEMVSVAERAAIGNERQRYTDDLLRRGLKPIRC